MITQSLRSASAPAGSPGWIGRKVRLRAITAADQRTLAGFDRDSASGRAPQIGGYRHWAAHRASTGDDFQLAIETLRGRMLVGSVWIAETDPLSGRFGYGVGIAPRHRRCGYAADAIAVVLAAMFGERGFRKCEVSVYGGNLASLALHGSLGFREEGRRPDPELLRGQVKYPVTMGITAREFAARHPDFVGDGPLSLSTRGRHWRRRRGRHRRAADLG
ncbi:GNAT family N-acetyltransferase [Amycolatopsis samaneae]|uniref:GNAT family protein n=1 Tax=Amycolatopsis samaneae TaxID=664691 RepID=A0ABW5GNK7_9PSEU